MHRLTLLLFAIFCFYSLGCGGVYTPYDPGFYNDNPDDYNYQDNSPLWSQDLQGEWEGFLYENWRSDNLGLSKKLVAMRFQWTDTEWLYGERHEWVNVNLLINGRPTAYLETEVDQDGHIIFDSQKDDIDLGMEGWFDGYNGDGWIDLAWDEKVNIPGTGQVVMHYVELSGDFEVGRVRGSQWATAWKLFDTYGEKALDLSDDVWQTATQEAITSLQQVDQTRLRK
jgi:hypothetical protein